MSLRIRDNSHVAGYLLSDDAPVKMTYGKGETVGSVMSGGTVYHQHLPRKWSKIERAMLMDLGYKIKQ